MSDIKRAADRIIVALDTNSVSHALDLVQDLTPTITRFKVGLELFCAGGMDAISGIHSRGGEVFLDLKLHDIPNTVKGAAAVLRDAEVWMTNVHASGGVEMMRNAREALPETTVLAVTVLTSFSQESFDELLGVERSIPEMVGRWAQSTAKAGLDGVVCSPQEIQIIREEVGDDFLIVTPGIRPEWAATGDQRRITTPAEAVQRGSDYLVIGRPIRQADQPKQAAERIIDEITNSVEGSVN